MTTNGNDYANPISADVLEKHRQGHYKNAGEPNPFGLTKREHFAAMAMQGMLHIGAMTKHGVITQAPSTIAMLAVNQADELIKALNEGGENA